MTLYAVLAGLLTGRPLGIVRAVANRNGYEAWRLLLADQESTTSSRLLALLDRVLDGKALANVALDRFEEAVFDWERQVQEHGAAAAQPLQEQVKVAILVACAAAAARARPQQCREPP